MATVSPQNWGRILRPKRRNSTGRKRSFLPGIGKRLIQPGSLSTIKGGEFGVGPDWLFGNGWFDASIQKRDELMAPVHHWTDCFRAYPFIELAAFGHLDRQLCELPRISRQAEQSHIPVPLKDLTFCSLPHQWNNLAIQKRGGVHARTDTVASSRNCVGHQAGSNTTRLNLRHVHFDFDR